MSEGTAFFAFVISLIALCWWRLEVGSARERQVLLWLVTPAIPLAAITAVAVLADADRARAVHPAGLTVITLILFAALLVGLFCPDVVDVSGLLVSAVVGVVVATAYIAAFVGLCSVLGLVGASTESPATFALIGVVCAAGVHPLQVVLRTVIDQLLFGDRPDPLSAATKVADSMNDDPALALDAVRAALLLPFAALVVDDRTLATTGASVRHTRSLPLRLGADEVGELVVGLRPGDLRLSTADEQVLRVVAPLLAQTVRLRASREAAISGIEEERQRLRRDLHDGLGPTLTGVAYAVDAARNVLGADPAAADRHLALIRSSTENAITEIRRLVEGLRPPALDELGLVAALRLHAASLPLAVTVTAGALPPLGAAIEVAAYRIGVEALTNVVRHSGATSAALVIVATPHSLTVEVADDGSDASAWQPGTGITSMHQRAALVGGHLVAGDNKVVATLPL